MTLLSVPSIEYCGRRDAIGERHARIGWGRAFWSGVGSAGLRRKCGDCSANRIFGAHTTFSRRNNDLSAAIFLVSHLLLSGGARHSLYTGWLTTDYEMRSGRGALRVVILMVIAALGIGDFHRAHQRSACHQRDCQLRQSGNLCCFVMSSLRCWLCYRA